MAELMSIDMLNEQLRGRIDSLVPALYPNAKLVAGIWRIGSVRGEAGTSLGIWSTGHKQGEWADYASREGGDPVGLVHAALGSGDWKRTFNWIRDWLGLGRGFSPEELRRREAEADASKRKRAADEREDRARKQASAMRHYLTGVPIPGTPAERYLIGRNIHLSRLGKAPGALKYHAAMRCPETGRDRPCLLALMQRIDEPQVTIHRTFLLQHEDGRVTKADVESGGDMNEAKVAYSAYSGAWIPCWRGASGQPIRKMPLGEWICVTEGIEDALTIAMARPDMRVVAALSLSNIGALALPERAGGLFLCADNDSNEDAKRGFARAKARLLDRGFKVVEFRPPAQFKDFNEWAGVLAGRAA